MVGSCRKFFSPNRKFCFRLTNDIIYNFSIKSIKKILINNYFSNYLKNFYEKQTWLKFKKKGKKFIKIISWDHYWIRMKSVIPRVLTIAAIIWCSEQVYINAMASDFKGMNTVIGRAYKDSFVVVIIASRPKKVVFQCPAGRRNCFNAREDDQDLYIYIYMYTISIVIYSRFYRSSQFVPIAFAFKWKDFAFLIR